MKIKRRPPGTIHVADLAAEIERAVWVRIANAKVSHVFNDHDQPDIIVTVGGNTVRVSLGCFCVDPESPWIKPSTLIDDIATAVVLSAKGKLGLI